MKRSSKFKSVQRYSKLKEHNASRELGKINQLLEQNRNRLADLRNYQEDYGQQFIQQGYKGVSAGQVRDYHRFMENLKKAIEQQTRVISQIEVQFEVARRQWLAARGKSKAIETVVNQHLTREQLQEDKRDQREIDDREAVKISYKNNK